MIAPEINTARTVSEEAKKILSDGSGGGAGISLLLLQHLIAKPRDSATIRDRSQGFFVVRLASADGHALFSRSLASSGLWLLATPSATFSTDLDRHPDAHRVGDKGAARADRTGLALRSLIVLSVVALT